MKTASLGLGRIKSFFDNYKALGIVSVLLIASLCARSQRTYDTARGLQKVEANGYSYIGIEANQFLKIPRDTIALSARDWPGLAYKGGQLWVFNGQYWVTSSSGSISSPGHGIDSLSYNSTTLFVWKDGENTAIPFTRFICYERDNYNGTQKIGYNCNDEPVDSSSNHTKWFKAGPNIVITQYGPYGDSVLFAATGGPGSRRLAGLIVSHDTLYKYDITAGTAVINDTLYISAQSHVTLQPADPTFNRKDVIADSLGVIVVKTGIPAADPVEPQVNPIKEIALTNITVTAGSTAPDNIVRNVIYDENTESWTHAKTGAFTVDFASTSTPFHLAKAIDIGAWSGTTNSITFTSPVKVNVSNYTLLKFAVDPKTALPSNAYIYLRLMNGGVGITPFVSLTSYGLNNSILAYQNVTIPISQLNPTDVQYDKIQMLFYGPSGGVYMDYIQLQGGVPQPTAGGTVTSFSKVDGFGITSSVSNPTTTPAHTIAADTTASGLSGKYFRISDTTNKWAQFVGLTAGGDSFYVVKNGILTKTKINASGSSGPPGIRTVTSGTTFTTSDYGILVNTASGNITINLDPTIGNYIGYIKKISTDANKVIVNMSSGTLDGDATRELVNPYEVVKFQFNSTNAFITY